MRTLIEHLDEENINKDRKSIQELFSDYCEEYNYDEFDFGETTGKEIM